MFFSLLFFIAFVTYLVLGNFALFKNDKSANNRMFFAITFLFAYWSLINAVLLLITDPEIAAFIRKASVICWGAVYSIILHFVLRLSGLDKVFDKKYKKISLYLFLYTPVIINLWFYFLNTYEGSELLLTNLGWVASSNVNRGYLWDNFFFFYYSSFMILTIISTIIWHRRTNKLREKTYSKYLLISFLFPFVLGSIFEIILPLSGIPTIQGITLFFTLIPIAIIYYIIEKYGFLNFDSNKLGTQVMKLTTEGVIICNIEGEIESINKGALELLGYEDESDLSNISEIGLNISEYETLDSTESVLLNKDGLDFFVLLSSKEIKDHVGELYGYILVFQDLSELKEVQYELKDLNSSLEDIINSRTKELVDLNKNLNIEISNRKKAEKEISDIAYKDYLTGVYNRRYYEEALIRYDKEEYYPISLVMADINGLKLINDAFGHLAGDKLLIKAASILLNNCKKQDVLSRIGGDEFVIIMPNTSSKEADEVINNINQQTQKVVINSIKLSISFGCRTKENCLEKIHEVFRNAEDLMYREKLLKIPSMRSSAIEAILKTLYEKDRDSEIHSRFVALYSEKLAEAYGLERQEISEVKTAGLLHDIGKILISQKILTKVGKLTRNEYIDMQNHSEIGFRVLNSSHEMRRISNIVLNHHERWDGTGYPRRVKGEEIPLTSRIISIADSFDAMTSKRSYKDIISKKDALQEIIENSGTQFDPNLVEVFKNNFEEITNIEEIKKVI